MDGNGKVERRQWHIHQLQDSGGQHKSGLRYTLSDYPGKCYARHPLRGREPLTGADLQPG